LEANHVMDLCKAEGCARVGFVCELNIRISIIVCARFRWPSDEAPCDLTATE